MFLQVLGKYQGWKCWVLIHSLVCLVWWHTANLFSQVVRLFLSAVQERSTYYSTALSKLYSHQLCFNGILFALNGFLVLFHCSCLDNCWCSAHSMRFLGSYLYEKISIQCFCTFFLVWKSYACFLIFFYHCLYPKCNDAFKQKNFELVTITEGLCYWNDTGKTNGGGVEIGEEERGANRGNPYALTNVSWKIIITQKWIVVRADDIYLFVYENSFTHFINTILST